MIRIPLSVSPRRGQVLIEAGSSRGFFQILLPTVICLLESKIWILISLKLLGENGYYLKSYTTKLNKNDHYSSTIYSPRSLAFSYTAILYVAKPQHTVLPNHPLLLFFFLLFSVIAEHHGSAGLMLDVFCGGDAQFIFFYKSVPSGCTKQKFHRRPGTHDTAWDCIFSVNEQCNHQQA